MAGLFLKVGIMGPFVCALGVFLIHLPFPPPNDRLVHGLGWLILGLGALLTALGFGFAYYNRKCYMKRIGQDPGLNKT